LSVAWAKHFHRYLVVTFTDLAASIYIGHASSTNTFDEEEEITQLNAFKKIRHATPHKRS
jgi:hypothetical protein